VLKSGAQTRDALVEEFITSLEQADTARLRELALTAGEFIDLYYPASIFARAPYKQSPELRWLLLQQQSEKGLNRLLQRFGGQVAGFQGYRCAVQQTEANSTISDRCTVEWAAHREPVRLFSTIIERDSRFKFVSFANDM
jgi:hypothetical protein